MKIDRLKHEEAYRCGQKVYAGTMRVTDARNHLNKIGVNPNSALDYVYGLKHLLNGERYTRTLPASVIEEYFNWIQRDYDKKFLRNAVSALKQHIEYYQSLTKSPMRGHVAILEKYRELLNDETDDFASPEEVPKSEHFDEGGTKTITVNVYERSAKARKACLAEFGCACFVCGFDFERKFGAIGKGFVHVHHLRDLATIGKEYKINPIEDLRPVCPNCHAMLHKSKPAYPIEELKKLIAAQGP